MRFLIIAAKFGSGHLSVSKAIAEQGDSNDTFDIKVPSSYKFELPNTKLSLYMYNNVVSRYTKDGLVKWFYNVSYKTARNTKFLFFPQKSDGCLRTKYILKNEQPDVIIETFPHLIQNTNGALRCCVITDYTFAKVYLSETKDAIYCVPAPFVKEEAINKYHLDPDKIFVTGIPVRTEFKLTNNQTSCKKVLLTLGARGQISKKDVDIIIDACLDNNLTLDIVCGKNEKIYEYLKVRDDINVHGYVNNMYDFYKQADLIITKSGGISVSECICAEKPMIINIDQSMSGQEEENQKYILREKIGLCSKVNKIKDAITSIAQDDNLYQELVANIKKAKQENYQHEILDVVKKQRYLQLENNKEKELIK